MQFARVLIPFPTVIPFRQVRGAMEIALFIQNLQEERAEVALFIFTKQSAGASFNLTALRTNKRLGV